MSQCYSATVLQCYNLLDRAAQVLCLLPALIVGTVQYLEIKIYMCYGGADACLIRIKRARVAHSQSVSEMGIRPIGSLPGCTWEKKFTLGPGCTDAIQ